MSGARVYLLRVAVVSLLALYSLQAAVVQAGPVQIPQTGQQICWNAEGGEIPCSGSGQDGDLPKGEVWPASRFMDNGQTITDTLTGLMWTKDANAPGPAGCGTGPKNWQGALDHLQCLNANAYLGYNDWRLPNVRELRSLIHYGHPSPSAWLKQPEQGFTNVQAAYYWSSSSFLSSGSTITAAWAWAVGVWSGGVEVQPKSDSLYIWPVRAGQ